MLPQERRNQNHQIAIIGGGWQQSVCLADLQVVGAKPFGFDLRQVVANQTGVIALTGLDGLGDFVQMAIQRWRELGAVLRSNSHCAKTTPGRLQHVQSARQ